MSWLTQLTPEERALLRVPTTVVPPPSPSLLPTMDPSIRGGLDATRSSPRAIAPGSSNPEQTNTWNTPEGVPLPNVLPFNPVSYVPPSSPGQYRSPTNDELRQLGLRVPDVNGYLAQNPSATRGDYPGSVNHGTRHPGWDRTSTGPLSEAMANIGWEPNNFMAPGEVNRDDAMAQWLRGGGTTNPMLNANRDTPTMTSPVYTANGNLGGMRIHALPPAAPGSGVVGAAPAAPGSGGPSAPATPIDALMAQLRPALQGNPHYSVDQGGRLVAEQGAINPPVATALLAAMQIQQQAEDRRMQHDPSRERERNVGLAVLDGIRQGLAPSEARRQAEMAFPVPAVPRTPLAGLPTAGGAAEPVVSTGPQTAAERFRNELEDLMHGRGTNAQGQPTRVRRPVADFIADAMRHPHVVANPRQFIPELVAYAQANMNTPGTGEGAGPTFNQWWQTPHPALALNDTPADVTRRALEEHIRAIDPAALSQVYGGANWFSPVVPLSNATGLPTLPGTSAPFGSSSRPFFGNRGSYYNRALPVRRLGEVPLPAR